MQNRKTIKNERTADIAHNFRSIKSCLNSKMNYKMKVNGKCNQQVIKKRWIDQVEQKDQSVSSHVDLII